MNVKKTALAVPREHSHVIGPATSLLLAVCLLLLGGCATFHAIEDHVAVGVTEQTTFYRDQWVQRSPPEVHVQPKSQATFAPKVLFVPLRVTQPMQHPGIVSHSISRAVYQTWNSMQLFPTMEFSSDDNPYRRDRAIALGRQRGADVVVGGFVTYYYSGGTVGDSQVSIQIEAHDLSSGQLIWSMAQSGMVPAAQSRDYIIFATKMRVPTDPAYAISKSIAIDMGKHIQNWMAPAPPKTKLQQHDEDIKNTLFPERDPVPPPRVNPEEARGYSQDSF